MTVLVAGATGATGRLLVEQLLERGVSVKVIVRPQSAWADMFADRGDVTVISAPILDLSDADLARHVADCDALASCLGHNLTLKGLFGPPRRLVTDAVRRLCRAFRISRDGGTDSGGNNRGRAPVRVVLMNTAGYRNPDLDEPISIGQRLVVGLIRLLVPPHSDNEYAADFLRVDVGQDDTAIKWVVVRPDTLIDAESVSPYSEHPSPTRSAIFNPGKTSRINVADFMARLITDDALWSKWRGRMPVIYDTEPA